MIILRTVKNFSSLNVVASILLFLTAILAAVVANSSLSSVYQDFLLQELHLRKTHKCLRTNFFSGNAAVRYPYIRINF